jgi:hypothetical protein
MKKILMALCLLLSFGGFSQSLTEVLFPKFIQGVGSGNAADERKIPFAARMKVDGLTPNATYRGYNRFVTDPTIPDNGQGNYIVVNPVTGVFSRVTSATLSVAGRYFEFTTDATGSFTGWFIGEPTIATTHYQPGTQLYFRLLLNNGAGGTAVVTRVTNPNPVTVLGFGAGPTQATGIRSTANAAYTAKNFVMLYDNIAGTGRPVMGTFIEDDGTDNSVANGYAPFYGNSVNAVGGTWGAIIPNNLSSGINNVSQYSLTSGGLVNSCTAANGVFGAANTANASGGLNELVFSCTPTGGCNLSLSDVGTNVLCNGGSTGAINLTVAGANGPVTYAWSNGATTEDLTGLAAGTYTVTVTETGNTSCSATRTVTIAQPTQLVAASTAGSITVNGGTTTVTVTATGGTAPYTGTGTFTRGAGAYSYTVTDANGCTSVTTGTISEPSVPLSATGLVGTPIACFGGTTTVTISATGGVTPYTGTGVFTTGAGLYRYVVKDANNDSLVVTGTIAQPTQLVAASTAGTITVSGGTTTVTVTATGGTAPYTGTGSFTRGAGAYSYTVTDANGCTAVTTGTISEPSALVASAILGTPIACFGGTTSVTVSATGGVTPYTGTGTFTRSAGAYSYTVTDANGATSTVTGTIAQPAQLVASSVAGTITVFGGTTTVVVSATGGTAPYTGTGTFTRGAGAYSYTVTDANGCTSVTTGTISQPGAPVTATAVVGAAILCNGGTTTVTVTATGGVAPYTGTGVFTRGAGAYRYVVKDANNDSSVVTGTITQPTLLVPTATVTPLPCTGNTTTVTVAATGGTAPYTGTGTFTVSSGPFSFNVTDANGCVKTVTGQVVQPLLASVSANPIACGATTTLVTVTAGGGNAPFTGTGTFNVGPGTYTYTVTDSRGCSASSTITVASPVCLVLSDVYYPRYVQGSGTGNAVDDRKVPYAARMTVSGLKPGTTYRYYNRFVQAGDNTSNGQGNYILPSTAGNFTRVTAASFSIAGRYGEFTTDATGAYTGWFIGEPTLAIDFQPGNELYLRLNLNDGANGTNVVSRVTASSPIMVLGFGATPTNGTGIRSTANNTYTSKNFVMLYDNVGGTGRPIAGTFIESDGTDNTVANGYAPFYANSVNGVDKTWGSIIPNNLSNGINSITQYSLSTGLLVNTCTSPNGVFGTTSTVNANGGLTELVISCTPAPICNVKAVLDSSRNVRCNGGNTGAIGISVTGAVGPVTYSWSNGATSQDLSGLVAGTYKVIVTDSLGCKDSLTQVITQPTALVASSVAGTAACGGTATVVVSATGGTAPYTGTGTFTRGAGVYSYTVTDANGCTSITTGNITTASDTIKPTITAPAALSVNTNSGCSAIGINLGTPITADNCSVASVTNNAPLAFPLGATTVTWTVTDGSGNTATATQVVTVADNVKPAIYFQGTSLLNGITGPSSSATPYLLPTTAGGKFTSILTVNDVVGGYRMAGIPDGLGAFDNNNGTFTLLMNHEIGNTLGAVRAHGSKGAFVSKWIINKSSLTVQSGTDLMQRSYLWNTTTNSFTQTTSAFSRFCSADLPAVSAFYNQTTGLGTQERIFMNGEESGTEGRAVGHIVTGSAAGNSYELPYLGKFSWENAVASPVMSNKTIVAGLDDNATNGQVYFYIGTKTNTGTDIDKAGLNNGKLFGVKVNGLASEVSASTPAVGTRFDLFDLGSVQNTTGVALNTASLAGGVTNFLRPEDGGFDPANPNDFYFATTNGFNSPSRLWRLRFDNIATPETGGTIEAVLNGTEGQQMFDNFGFDKLGHILLQEDVGNNDHNGKIWQYTIATDALTLVAKHDPARFGDLVGSTITPATAPFNRDEESSGMIDVSEILGPGMFLLDDQAHYVPATNAAEVVEGGQLLAFFNPASLSTGTLNAAPDTIKAFAGNGCVATGVNLGTPATADNCSVASVTNNAPASFPIGNTTVIWTVTDGSGNTNTAQQIVVVRDTTKPTISAPANLNIGPNGAGCTSATGVVLGTPVTADNCSLATVTNNAPASFPIGTTTVIWTVTDASGNTASTTQTVTVTSVTASSVAGTITVFGGTTTVVVSATGGTVPYTGTGTFTRGAGAYSYTVTDANGCTSVTTGTISEPNATLVATSTIGAPIACNGGSTTIIVSATGGVAPYTGTGSFTIGAGTYSYTVTDAVGATAVTIGTITQPTVVVATATSTVIPCFGDSTTITISATGGTAPYTGTGTFRRVAGAYNFTVTDANGCSKVASITVTQSATSLAATATASTIACFGDSATITVSATGGTAPYIGTGTFKRVAGNYSFVVKDARECSKVVSISITQPTSALVASATSTIINCNGDSAIVTVTATGGTAPYTGTGTFKSVAGSYSFTVTDAKGCSKVASITITQPTPIVVTATAPIIPCDSTRTTVTVSATGGSAPYTGTGTFARTAGTYTFTVTDAKGCSKSTTITIAPSLPCNNGCTFNSSITQNFNNVSISQGRYIWFNSVMNLDYCVPNNIAVNVRNAKITFKVNGNTITLPVPDARIRFSTSTTVASTTFVNGKWETVSPLLTYGRNVFMSGLSYLMPSNLPANIQDVKWTADISTDRGVEFRWQWGAAVYTQFSTNYPTLGVKPIDFWLQNPYYNFDLAGSPQNFKSRLVSGGTGFGYYNYTGYTGKTRKIDCPDGSGYALVNANDPEAKKEVLTAEVLDVKAFPNPSPSYFNLQIKSTDNAPINVRIMDLSGKLVSVLQNVAGSPNEEGVNIIVRIGESLGNGIFFAEVMQGKNRKIVKLVKGS